MRIELGFWVFLVITCFSVDSAFHAQLFARISILRYDIAIERSRKVFHDVMLQLSAIEILDGKSCKTNQKSTF